MKKVLYILLVSFIALTNCNYSPKNSKNITARPQTKQQQQQPQLDPKLAAKINSLQQQVNMLEKQINRTTNMAHKKTLQQQYKLLEMGLWCLRKGGPLSFPIQKVNRPIKEEAQLLVEHGKFLQDRGFTILRGEDPHLYMKWVILYAPQFQPIEKWSVLQPKERMSFIILDCKPVRYILLR